jgi:hypothetical protein
MLNQSIGSWNRRKIPASVRICGAACGIKQALFTALKFPQAMILGTALSSSSEQIAGRSATGLGLTNFKIRQESINDTH